MTPHSENARRTRWTSATFIAAVSLSAAAVAAALLCATLFPGPLPAPRDPHFVDVVFDSRPVVWAARLLLVSAAFVLAVGGAYIVGSTIVRMRNGEWLKRAGPFEVAETVLADLEDQIRFWRSAALDDQDEIESLRARLAASDKAIEQLIFGDDFDML